MRLNYWHICIQKKPPRTYKRGKEKLMETGLRGWFLNRKTQTKLMLGFSLVSVIILIVAVVGVYGLLEVRQTLDTVYTDSTLALANLAMSGSNLGLYHDKVLQAARSRNKHEFAAAIKSLAALKNGTLQPLQTYAKQPMLRSSQKIGRAHV